MCKAAPIYSFPMQVFLLWDSPIAASIQEQYCESLLPTTNHTGPQCNASVDLIGTCWPRSAVGQLVARPCPEYFYGVRYNTTNNGYRECLANGSWAARVNYSQCQEILSEEKKSKLHYHIAVIINYLGHCVSLGALLVAFVLFMRLRSIRCLRNIIHWNLITAFILRNATWFVVQFTMNPEVHESNVVWCRLVTAAYNYFHVTNFFWMFGEGCYLHTAIVLTYSTDKLRKWMFICIGWCIPFPIIVAWAIGKLYYDNEKCWFGKRAGVYTDYIYQGPMILVLLINFIFLFNIVRILMTKLRASTTSETIQYRKAVKATLVLLPLLGITYMLFFVNPGEDEISRIVFIYFNSFLESFQGFFVSVFYCFLNSEFSSCNKKVRVGNQIFQHLNMLSTSTCSTESLNAPKLKTNDTISAPLLVLFSSISENEKERRGDIFIHMDSSLYSLPCSTTEMEVTNPTYKWVRDRPVSLATGSNESHQLSSATTCKMAGITKAMETVTKFCGVPRQSPKAGSSAEALNETRDTDTSQEGEEKHTYGELSPPETPTLAA
ncbi:hypothetical protein ASZ78_005246 [Callipepla squamata]|uniref:Corticotropin-releasing factor receptor 1 n=1 Tax=Callipepla squamata TaxID=9009 RepID=A0A226N030_CALSU|nr:hypothetical protein ASZ78_005246 [Callipepla squamata]